MTGDIWSSGAGSVAVDIAVDGLDRRDEKTDIRRARLFPSLKNCGCGCCPSLLTDINDCFLDTTIPGDPGCSFCGETGSSTEAGFTGLSSSPGAGVRGSFSAAGWLVADDGLMCGKSSSTRGALWLVPFFCPADASTASLPGDAGTDAASFSRVWRERRRENREANRGMAFKR